jgi:hypothetical protein
MYGVPKLYDELETPAVHPGQLSGCFMIVVLG